MENTMRGPNWPLTDAEKKELLALGIEQFLVDNTQRDTYDHIKNAQKEISKDLRQRLTEQLADKTRATIVRDYIKMHLSNEWCNDTRKELDTKLEKRDVAFLEDYPTRWNAAWEQKDYETLFKIAYGLNAGGMGYTTTQLLVARYDTVKPEMIRRQQKKAQAAALTSSRDGVLHRDLLAPLTAAEKQQLIEHGIEQPLVDVMYKTDFDCLSAAWNNPKDDQKQVEGQETIRAAKQRIARGYIEDMIPKDVRRELGKKYHDISEKNDVQPPDDYEAQWKAASKNRDYETLFGLAYLLEDANWHTELGELLEKEYDVIQAQQAQRDKEAERLYEKVSTKERENGTINQGDHNESREPRAVSGSEGKDHSQGAGRGGNAGNVQERQGGTDSQVGGAPGRGHSTDGHGDDIPGRSAPSDNTVPSGRVSVSELDDGTGGIGVLEGNLPQRGLEGQLQEPVGSVQQPVDGDGLDSPRTRGQIAAIRERCREILQKSDDDITDADKAILSQYEGGGGIKQEKDRSVDAVLNEFYTPRNVINKVWGLVDYYVPDAETVLEPSSGIGRFAEGRMQNKVTLRELDATSARIARLLHPDAEVIQGAFQAQFFDSNGIARKKDFALPKYDVVIGNPPYGAYTKQSPLYLSPHVIHSSAKYSTFTQSS